MMKSFSSSLLALALCSSAALAQEAPLPRPSPFAKASQTVGLTDITVDYSTSTKEITASINSLFKIYPASMIQSIRINGSANPENVSHDTEVDRVLISDQFTYWGGQGPEIPARFRDYRCFAYILVAVPASIA